MLINYTFDKCVEKIVTARILRNGQEQFCNKIDSFIASLKYFKEMFPEESVDFIDDAIIDRFTELANKIRNNIRELDKITGKIDLLEQTRLINHWCKQMLIEDIKFPDPEFPKTTYMPEFTEEYIEAKSIYEREVNGNR